jgi:RNA polymerase sigma-70 factor (ECF subfamily)
MDSDEFAQIVAQYYEPLYRFALSLTRAEADASDLTQHTFYAWATKGHQLRDHSKTKTWLFTTLHRAFLGGYRRRSRFPHHGLDEVAVEDLPVSTPAYSDAVDSTQVLSALEKVDEVYQAAVALFYLEEYSYLEIAEVLEVPLGTVKSRIARGIAQLRTLMGIELPEPVRERATQKAQPKQELPIGETNLLHQDSEAHWGGEN